MKSQLRKKKWVTQGEAYFDKTIRDGRYEQLKDDTDLMNVRRGIIPEYNPATRRLENAWVVEWEELKEPEKPEIVN